MFLEEESDIELLNDESESEDDQTSFEYDFTVQSILEQLKHNKIVQTLTILDREIQKRQRFDSELYMCRALSYLHSERAQSCIRDCSKIIDQDPGYTLAYLIKGIAYLWISNEDNALRTWLTGLEQGGDFIYYMIMNSLIQNANVDKHFYSLRFNVVSLFQAIDGWDSTLIFTESDTQAAYTKLRKHDASGAITHFTQIIMADPSNNKAYAGRGIANAILGQWSQAISDITTAYTMSDEVVDSLKFRAAAYAASGQTICAISDLTTYLSIFPRDYEARIERARLYTMQKMYKYAIRDFSKVPYDRFTSSAWQYSAEAFYSIGRAGDALNCIAKINERNAKTLYLEFLIWRDLSQPKKALEAIKQAASSGNCYLMDRAAADFLVELGKPKEALPYILNANSHQQNDLETNIFYVNVLIMLGRTKEASAILSSMQNDPGQRNGRILNFDEPLEDYQNKIHLCYTQIATIDGHIASTSASLLKQMFADADRIGARCVSNAPGTIVNPRLARALGFCVLRGVWLIVESKRRPEKQREIYLKDLVRDFCSLLQFADFTKAPTINIDGTYNGQRPIFYILKKHKIPPRYGSAALSLAVDRFATSLKARKATPLIDLISISTPDEVLAASQSDLYLDAEFWNYKDKKWLRPGLFIHNRGILGPEIYVRPPHSNNPPDLINYKSNLTNLDAIKEMILIFWLRHPLTRYSPEIGKALVHMYALATQNAEIKEFNEENGELFIRLMISQDYQEVFSYVDYLMENSLVSIVGDNSIGMWNQVPNSSTLLSWLSIE